MQYRRPETIARGISRRGGQFFDLGGAIDPSPFTGPLDTDNGSDVVGHRYGPDFFSSAFLYRNGQRIDIPPPPGHSSSALTRLNNRGEAIGLTFGIVSEIRVFLWRRGETIRSLR